jgi:hypothetical protein
LAAATTPTLLRILMIVLLLASLAWGAVGAWAVNQHASAAQDVVSTSEPLSLSAQQMYRSLSDADVTAATAFLNGPYPSLQARQGYDADLAQAATDLTRLTDAATTASNPQLLASLNAVSTGLNVYTGYVRQAQTWYTLGYLLTGGSFMQDATEVMHLTLLPAARTIYAQENAGLTTASAQATGLPWIVVVLVLALVIGVVLFRVQRWLWQRDVGRERVHRPGSRDHRDRGADGPRVRLGPERPAGGVPVSPGPAHAATRRWPPC